MFLPDLAIKRPVFILMQVAAILVLGWIAYTRIPIDLMPDVQFPFMSITTVYPGTGAKEIESDVTKKIEEGMSSISGLKNIYSTSAEGYSQVLLEFNLDVKIRDADMDVREQLSKIRSELPKDVDEPSIARFDISATPVMIFALSSDMALDKLRTLAEDKVKNRIEQTNDVAGVDLVGGWEREIKVELDSRKLEAYDLPIQQVISALSSENLNVPGGRMNQEPREIVLRTTGEFQTVDQINRIMVGSRQGVPTYVRDIARVKDAFKDLRKIAKLNGKPSVSFIVHKQSGGNTVKVCDDLKKTFSQLKKELPSGTTIEIASDYSKYIRRSVNDTMLTLYLGALFVTLVVLLFMGNLRSTIIAALAIPTSIFATFILMYAFGYSLNILTLMGLSLAVGILIDDAIVVRENIFRHMEEGMEPEKAASFGASEVGLAVMACTFSIVAVFLPVAYTGGIVGKFFKSFAFTVTFAVLYSLWDSFTMAPMLSARFMGKQQGKEGLLKKLFRPFESFYLKVNKGYRRLLEWSLNHKTVVLAMASVLFLISLSLIPFIGKEMMPQGDRGEFKVDIETAIGSSISNTENVAAKVEDLLLTYPEVKAVFTTVGLNQGAANQASLRIELVDLNQRKRTTDQVEEELRRKLSEFPGVKSKVSMIGLFEGQAQEFPVELYIKGPDIDVLNRLSQAVLEIVKNTPSALDADRSLRGGKPEVQVVIDREQANRLGISTGQVASTLRSLVDGTVATKFKQEDKEIDVRVSLTPDQKNSLTDIASVPIQTPFGSSVPLKAIASFVEATGPSNISRQNRERLATVTANIGNRPLGSIMADINRELSKLPLPTGYKIEARGQTETMQEMFSNLLLALALAVIFIYMVLASQFNSFLHPFTIMLALPLAVVGALFAVFLTGQRINMQTMIGIILLFGIVTKNSILLVDYTITLRKRGMERIQALLTAGPVRFRPIVMTSVAMIMGMLPAALGMGEGGEWRQVMGITVIGGLITSTFLSLIIVPIAYLLVDNLENRFKKNKNTTVNSA
ncbi:MAG: efflux RND transporter permease subunit [candidate division Zixibacteria bacterium]|nr:efflux RND transporter permease subunit [candidate division Zixibacteria bacterium]